MVNHGDRESLTCLKEKDNSLVKKKGATFEKTKKNDFVTVSFVQHDARVAELPPSPFLKGPPVFFFYIVVVVFSLSLSLHSNQLGLFFYYAIRIDYDSLSMDVVRDFAVDFFEGRLLTRTHGLVVFDLFRPNTVTIESIGTEGTVSCAPSLPDAFLIRFPRRSSGPVVHFG